MSKRIIFRITDNFFKKKNYLIIYDNINSYIIKKAEDLFNLYKDLYENFLSIYKNYFSSLTAEEKEDFKNIKYIILYYRKIFEEAMVQDKREYSFKEFEEEFVK